MFFYPIINHFQLEFYFVQYAYFTYPIWCYLLFLLLHHCVLQILEGLLKLPRTRNVLIVKPTMGNEKSSSYWEAELPPNYDRVGIENFIHAKYEDKRWVPRDTTSRPTPNPREEKSLDSWQRSSNSSRNDLNSKLF